MCRAYRSCYRAVEDVFSWIMENHIGEENGKLHGAALMNGCQMGSCVHLNRILGGVLHTSFQGHKRPANHAGLLRLPQDNFTTAHFAP